MATGWHGKGALSFLSGSVSRTPYPILTTRNWVKSAMSFQRKFLSTFERAMLGINKSFPVLFANITSNIMNDPIVESR